ncbi:MAG: pilus assembly protein, partial [Deltaproteobacteria bacterium]
MLAFRRIFCSTRGQAIVELTLTLPLLIVLGLGAIEFGNMINTYLVLTHLTREGANLTSRQDGTKGTSAWRDKINADLQAAIDAASPIITSTNL